MQNARPGLRIGIIEPHLDQYGGIRRMVEFANRLTARGHRVTFYLPANRELRCGWMRCDAEIDVISGGVDDELDVVMFNEESQWYLLDQFRRARRRIFYALHDGSLYGKPGSWEAIRTEVDLQLANSAWTADRIEAAIGVRPTVALGGVDRGVFRPHGGPKRYDVLTMGRTYPSWKGHDLVVAAAAAVGREPEVYNGRGLSQSELGRAYDAARIFAVGSWFEGFGQPGLEALACGVPLVTTDNGGCREYAVHEETALVVEPGDVQSMAVAMGRLLEDDVLVRRLTANGLGLVADAFDWERRTDEFATLLDGVVAGHLLAPPPRPAVPTNPELSVVVDGHGRRSEMQAVIQSLRANTDVVCELIVVDRATRASTSDYLRRAADHYVPAAGERYAAALDRGLSRAIGAHVAFCGPGGRVEPGWASRAIDVAVGTGGLVIARAGTPAVDTLEPFGSVCAGPTYVLATDLARELGGWDGAAALESGDALDLAYRHWVNGRPVSIVSGLVGAADPPASLVAADAWREPWARRRRAVLRRWMSEWDPSRLDSAQVDGSWPRRAAARRAAASLELELRQRERTSGGLWAAAVARLRRGTRAFGERAWVRWGPRLSPTARRLVRRVRRRGGR